MAALRNAALLALLGLLCVTGAVQAQGPRCAPRDALLEALAERYGEVPIGRGITNAGGLIEVLASPSGSWSILVTTPGGATCLVSSGEGWRRLPHAGKDEGPAA